MRIAVSAHGMGAHRPRSAGESLAWLVGGALALAASGCTATPAGCDRTCVATEVSARTGLELGSSAADSQVVLPNGANLAAGLSEDEAVLIALWNNAAFQALLTELDIAQGDLVQAGLLPNPEAAYFFEVSGKPFKYAFDLPLEALWLRPIRVAAAERESARVCDQLTQAALDLIRDVRQSYADVLLARGRHQVAEEAVRIRGRIAELAEARLKAGDVSVQEAATARIDALQARQDALRSEYAISTAEERLRHLLGLGLQRAPLRLEDAPTARRADLKPAELTAEAVSGRPDALAAEESIAAAAERLRLARLGWVRLHGVGDATSGTRTGHEFGPAFRVTLPVFHWNQGNIARAEAELERAERHRAAVRDQIVYDVHYACLRYAQARAELDVLEQQVQPEVDAAIRRAESAYREGNTPYVVVLETTRQLLDARVRQQELRGELRRAWVELERSVGRRLDAEPPLPNTSAVQSNP